MATVTVKYGQSLWDVVLNATGSLSNLDLVLEANGFLSWTPILVAGQTIIIPDTVSIDENTKRQLSSYPASNNSVSDVNTKIVSIFTNILEGWILSTGNWDDSQIWKDDRFWID